MTSYRDTRIYGVAEIGELLCAADRHLAVPARVVIIGGAAAAFQGAESTTTDVDTCNALDAELEDALDRARAETGLELPVQCSTVADVPYNYEDPRWSQTRYDWFVKRALVCLCALGVAARTSAADRLAPLTFDLDASLGVTYSMSDAAGRGVDGFSPQIGVGVGLGAYLTPDLAVLARARVGVGGIGYEFVGATVRYHLSPKWFVEAGPMYGGMSNLRDDETMAEASGFAVDARVGRLFGHLLVGVETTTLVTHDEDVNHLRAYDFTVVIAVFGHARAQGGGDVTHFSTSMMMP